MTTRREIVAAVGFVALTLYLVLFAVDATRFGHIHTGDSDNLVAGSRVALDCLRDGNFVGCGRYEGSIQTAVFPYPLLQYLPAIGMVWLRMNDDAVLHALRWLNFAAMIGTVVLAYVSLHRRRRLAWVACVAILGSSLLYQANAAFGEALAALAVTAAVASALARRPLLVLACAFLACTGKETFGPFVAVFCIVAARHEGDRWLPQRKLVLAAIGGSLAGMGAGFLFNVFRFGGPRNVLYLDEPFRTQGSVQLAKFYGALWASPAGGVAFFWPIVFVIVCVAVVSLVRRRAVGRVELAYRAASLIALVVFFGGLALWYSPFGWITFGPRLAVPMLPAATIVLLHQFGDDVLGWLGRRRTTALVASTGLSVIAAPMFGSPWRWFPAVLQTLVPGGRGCAPLTGLSIYQRPAEYYRCTNGVMWRLRPQMLDDTFRLDFSLAGTAWLLAVVGSALVLFAAFAPVAERLDRRPAAGDPLEASPTAGARSALVS